MRKHRSKIRKNQNLSSHLGLLYEEVTEIFVRVNSLGAKLRSSDLALAQITATWRNSLNIFQEFEETCKKQSFDLGLSIHLKNLVSFATGQSRFRAVSGLSKDHIEKGWEAAKQGMDFALNFLRSNAGIDSLALLSSPFIIISIASYSHFKDYHLTPDEGTAPALLGAGCQCEGALFARIVRNFPRSGSSRNPPRRGNSRSASVAPHPGRPARRAAERFGEPQ